MNAVGGTRPSLDWLIARPIAHRGLHNAEAGVVENTISAFAKAIRHGYAIECDLQVSADGEAMVFHDYTLERLTEAGSPTNEIDSQELQRLPIKQSVDRMQTLEQLLQQVDNTVPLVIELKSRFDASTSLVERACEIVSGYHGRFCLMSFDPFIMSKIREIAPHIPRGLVMGAFKPENWPTLSLTQLDDLRDPVHIEDVAPHFMSSGLLMLDSDKVRTFRANGGPVICWTVTSAEQAKVCYKLCDQITFEGFMA